MSEHHEIPGYPGYEMDRSGNIWSRWERRKGTTRQSGGWIIGETRRRLSVHKCRFGYLHIGIWRDGKFKRHLIHHLVLMTFVGPRPDGLVACHNNGKKTDNRPENLRWDTPESNDADMVLHGSRPRGSRNGAAKLREADIPEIRRLRAEGLTLKTIGDRFGMHFTTISLIIRGKKWRHIT